MIFLGKYDCTDHSDEAFQECIKVGEESCISKGDVFIPKKHWNEVLAVLTSVIIVFTIGATVCYLFNNKIVVIKCYGR